MSTSVMTVLGPVAPAALGVTDAHSHLYIAPVPGGAADAPVAPATATIQPAIARRGRIVQPTPLPLPPVEYATKS